MDLDHVPRFVVEKGVVDLVLPAQQAVELPGTGIGDRLIVQRVDRLPRVVEVLRGIQEVLGEG